MELKKSEKYAARALKAKNSQDCSKVCTIINNWCTLYHISCHIFENSAQKIRQDMRLDS